MKTLPPGVILEPAAGGLPHLRIRANNGEAGVFLHGAHVTHYQPRGSSPVLWVSRQSHFIGGTPGKPIRGGVPICFPWFGPRSGDPTAPAHGVARLLSWDLSEVEDLPDGTIRASLSLRADELAHRYSFDDWDVKYTVTVGAQLSLALRVRNTGIKPMTFEHALHTYFAVGDVTTITIRGLEDAEYIDKVDAFASKPASHSPITVRGETDRVYLNTLSPVIIEDAANSRRIRIRKEGSASTVVWNPWSTKAKAMTDFGDEEWREMVCVETANVGENAITLAPASEHVLSATLDVDG